MNLLRAVVSACAGTLICGLSASQTLDPPPSTIVDLAQKLHLTRVGDVITDGRTLFVCVESAEHVAYLLNAATYRRARSLPFSAPEGCDARLPSDLKRLNTGVLYRPSPVPGIFPEQVSTDSSFAGGKIFLRNAGTNQNCSQNLNFYYTVFYPTGSSYSFYLIVRLKQPIRPPVSLNCVEAAPPGKGRTYQFYFADEGFLKAIDNGNGTTLLIDANSNAAEPVLLAVKSLPDTGWSSQQNIFIVPHDSLEPRLQMAHGDPVKRFEALMSVIGQSGGYLMSEQ